MLNWNNKIILDTKLILIWQILYFNITFNFLGVGWGQDVCGGEGGCMWQNVNFETIRGSLINGADLPSIQDVCDVILLMGY